MATVYLNSTEVKDSAGSCVSWDYEGRETMEHNRYLIDVTVRTPFLYILLLNEPQTSLVKCRIDSSSSDSAQLVSGRLSG